MYKAYLYLTIATMCWGANAVFSRAAVGEVPPLMLVTIRWTGAVIIILLFSFKTVRQDWVIMKPRWGYLFLMGGMGFAIFNALMYVAAHTTTAVNIGIIQGGIPIFVLVWMFLIFSQRISLLQFLGVCLTLFGVTWVAAAGNLANLLSLAVVQGDLYMIIACMLYAGYAVGLKNKPDVSFISVFVAMAASAMIISLPMMAYEIVNGDSFWPTAKGWKIAFAITIFPSVIAQLCFILGVAQLGATRAGVFVNLVPIFASLFAVLFLSEQFHLYHGIALVLVLGGIWISERFNKSQQAT